MKARICSIAVLALILTGVAPAAFAFKMEAGTFTINATTGGSPGFTSQTFQQAYAAPPLVFILTVNTGGNDATLVRIRNVTVTGFEAVTVEAPGNDGAHAAVTFCADVAGNGSILGTAVNISTDTTAAEVAARLKTAIDAAGLNFTVTNAGAGLLNLTNTSLGTLGNISITETVLNAGHVVVGMSNGVGNVATVSIGTGDKIGLDPPAVNTTGTLTVDGTAEAVTIDNTAGQSGFSPTTAPNGAKSFVCYYNRI